MKIRVLLSLALLFVMRDVSMSRYTFDVREMDQLIDEAKRVPALLSIVREQLGVARFIAERTDFDSLDSYMNARYETDEFSQACHTEYFLKDYEVEHGRGEAFINYLTNRGLLDQKREWLFKCYLRHSSRCLVEFFLTQAPLINPQVCWIYHLTKFHRLVTRALGGKQLLKQSASLLAATSFLTKFCNDLGSMLLVNAHQLDLRAHLQECLHCNNRQLYGVARLLCRNHGSDGNDEDAECGIESYGELGFPRYLLDHQYYQLYYWYLQNRAGTSQPMDKRRLVNELGIYTRLYLAPENGGVLTHYWDD